MPYITFPVRCCGQSYGFPHCKQDAASLRPDAPRLLQAACAGCSSCCVVAVVESDVGRAAVFGAFEAAGLLGPARHQLPPHRPVHCLSGGV